MDFMTLREASEKMGRDPSMGKLLLRYGPYSRLSRNGDTMVDPLKCPKAGGRQDETREGFET